MAPAVALLQLLLVVVLLATSPTSAARWTADPAAHCRPLAYPAHPSTDTLPAAAGDRPILTAAGVFVLPLPTPTLSAFTDQRPAPRNVLGAATAAAAARACATYGAEVAQWSAALRAFAAGLPRPDLSAATAVLWAADGNHPPSLDFTNSTAAQLVLCAKAAAVSAGASENIAAATGTGLVPLPSPVAHELPPGTFVLWWAMADMSKLPSTNYQGWVPWVPNIGGSAERPFKVQYCGSRPFFGRLARTSSLTRTFGNLPPHKGVRIVVTIARLDQWESDETVVVRIDDRFMGSFRYNDRAEDGTGGYSQKCFASQKDAFLLKSWTLGTHTGSSVRVQLKGTLAYSNYPGESWGLVDFKLLLGQPVLDAWPNIVLLRNSLPFSLAAAACSSLGPQSRLATLEEASSVTLNFGFCASECFSAFTSLEDAPYEHCSPPNELPTPLVNRGVVCYLGPPKLTNGERQVPWDHLELETGSAAATLATFAEPQTPLAASPLDSWLVLPNANALPPEALVDPLTDTSPGSLSAAEASHHLSACGSQLAMIGPLYNAVLWRRFENLPPHTGLVLGLGLILLDDVDGDDSVELLVDGETVLEMRQPCQRQLDLCGRRINGSTEAPGTRQSLADWKQRFTVTLANHTASSLVISIRDTFVAPINTSFSAANNTNTTEQEPVTQPIPTLAPTDAAAVLPTAAPTTSPTPSPTASPTTLADKALRANRSFGVFSFTLDLLHPTIRDWSPSSLRLLPARLPGELAQDLCSAFPGGQLAPPIEAQLNAAAFALRGDIPSGRCVQARTANPSLPLVACPGLMQPQNMPRPQQLHAETPAAVVCWRGGGGGGDVGGRNNSLSQPCNGTLTVLHGLVQQVDCVNDNAAILASTDCLADATAGNVPPEVDTRACAESSLSAPAPTTQSLPDMYTCCSSAGLLDLAQGAEGWNVSCPSACPSATHEADAALYQTLSSVATCLSCHPSCSACRTAGNCNLLPSQAALLSPEAWGPGGGDDAVWEWHDNSVSMPSPLGITAPLSLVSAVLDPGETVSLILRSNASLTAGLTSFAGLDMSLSLFTRLSRPDTRAFATLEVAGNSGLTTVGVKAINGSAWHVLHWSFSDFLSPTSTSIPSSPALLVLRFDMQAPDTPDTRLWVAAPMLGLGSMAMQFSAHPCAPLSSSSVSNSTIDNSTYGCAACLPGSYLQNGMCINNCSVLGPLQITNPLDGRCGLCSDHCTACVGTASTCMACEVGFVLQDHACVIECREGYYAAPPARPGDTPLCTQCDSSCLACSGAGPNHCSACGGPAFLDGELSACVKTCPGGFYPNTTTRRCDACDVSCAACSSGAGMEACTDCRAGSVLQALASPLPGAYCLAECLPQHFVAPGRRCQPCHPLCRACNNSTAQGCTACGVSLVLGRNGSCQADCELGEYSTTAAVAAVGESQPLVTGVCRACNSTCRSCDISADNCTSCFPAPAAAPFLSGGACLASCPVGTAASAAASGALSQCTPVRQASASSGAGMLAVAAAVPVVVIVLAATLLVVLVKRRKQERVTLSQAGAGGAGGLEPKTSTTAMYSNPLFYGARGANAGNSGAGGAGAVLHYYAAPEPPSSAASSSGAQEYASIYAMPLKKKAAGMSDSYDTLDTSGVAEGVLASAGGARVGGQGGGGGAQDSRYELLMEAHTNLQLAGASSGGAGSEYAVAHSKSASKGQHAQGETGSDVDSVHYHALEPRTRPNAYASLDRPGLDGSSADDGDANYQHLQRERLPTVWSSDGGGGDLLPGAVAVDGDRAGWEAAPGSAGMTGAEYAQPRRPTLRREHADHEQVTGITSMATGSQAPVYDDLDTSNVPRAKLQA